MNQFPCYAFKKNPDGTWTCIQQIAIKTPTGEVKIGPGTTFRKGVLFMGIDLAKLLDEKCA